MHRLSESASKSGSVTEAMAKLSDSASGLDLYLVSGDETWYTSVMLMMVDRRLYKFMDRMA
jgi:hypothetical protein